METEDHTTSVFHLQLCLERPHPSSVARTESRPSSTARLGEQLVVSAELLENCACSPGWLFCLVQGSQQSKRTHAVTTAGGTARLGEQLVISVTLLENLASSPGQLFRLVQDLWKQALEEELGMVFGSQVPVRQAAEHPCQEGLTHVLAETISGSDQALSSVHPREPIDLAAQAA